MEGRPAACMAYGQTGSGKTYQVCGAAALSYGWVDYIDYAARSGVAKGHASVQLHFTGTDWAAYAM